MSPRASQQAETENSGKEPDFLVTAPQIDVKIPCYCFKVAKNGIAERDHLHMTKAEYRPILSQSEPGRDER
ncbi:hypothetical protein AOL_s00004g278 [Orbilia oligospora ATCC 24927]|uniref:Uncharacterized protein n=2 Tax=Orbilia oligospora TaxID=2813651 RepID=G1WYB8_ARTOA|nr:hypothetical protein AOL_s00004g278 [Orbilia oligospora ATCC 24927]EGX54245.1 hypothetical protein AOL_s00004g278 [Orbilia oligospora ATCC 24927]KAF3285994.1 hypothetical protein TWF970_009559 [Orbilia oligospora]